MTKTLNNFLANLPSVEQEAINMEAERLTAEEMTLRELREMLGCSQREVGEALNVNQAAISKVERRSDMRVSTLREFVRAIGGELDITVTNGASLKRDIPPLHQRKCCYFGAIVPHWP